MPHFVRIDLGLMKACEIVRDGVFGVEAEMLGVGADKSFIEDAAGELIEAFLFDCLQHARADLGDVRHVIEGELFALARSTEFISELAHCSPEPLGVPMGT